MKYKIGDKVSFVGDVELYDFNLDADTIYVVQGIEESKVIEYYNKDGSVQKEEDCRALYRIAKEGDTTDYWWVDEDDLALYKNVLFDNEPITLDVTVDEETAKKLHQLFSDISEEELLPIHDNIEKLSSNANKNELDAQILHDMEEYELRTGLIAVYHAAKDVFATEDGIIIPRNLYNFEGKCLTCDDFDIVSKNLYSSQDEIKDNKEKQIRLETPDGKYYIEYGKINGAPYVCGNLPDDLEYVILNMFKK